MWRFHQIHHSDPFVDVTTTYRTHPVETAWRFLFAIAPVWVLGIPAQAVVIQRILQTTNGVIEHANIRLWPPLDRILSLIWVTPNVHKIHHSRAVAETNSNYANLLTLYDRLLGTYTPAFRARSVVYGLDDADPGKVGSFRHSCRCRFGRQSLKAARRYHAQRSRRLTETERDEVGRRASHAALTQMSGTCQVLRCGSLVRSDVRRTLEGSDQRRQSR
jgi:hypothetical protein